MSNKHEAAYHNGTDACGCGSTHTSVMQAIYCMEEMETEQAQARKTPKPKQPSQFIRSTN